MKKIKKFRIHPRAASVLKGLKALRGETRLSPETEKLVETEMAQAKGVLTTAAAYNTYGPKEAPAWCVPLWEAAGENGAKPMALTLFAATIGPGLEDELARALTRGETLRSQILTALGEESAEQAGQFVCRLLAEEAKEESCTLSERALAEDTGRQRAILEALGADTIALIMDAAGHLSPRFTRLGWVSWYPPAKRKPGAKG